MKKVIAVVATLVLTLVLLAVVVSGLSLFSKSLQGSAGPVAPFPLHIAAATNLETIDQLVSDGYSVNELDDNGVTPLCLAAMFQKHEAVVKLLSYNADPNIATEGQDSPLTAAAMSGNLKIVQSLVDHNADVNAQFKSRTALHQAIIYGHTDIVKLLLDHPGIDVDQRERGSGYTPLHNAVQHDRIDFIAALLELGADPNVKDAVGNTPHDLAVHKSDTAIAVTLKGKDE